jgi:hypothetical protein
MRAGRSLSSTLGADAQSMSPRKRHAHGARMTEPLLLTATQISTYSQDRLLTKASGFFFARDERLYLVTSRHVLLDEPTDHFPDRLTIELHDDDVDLSRSTHFSVPLYHDGLAIWHQGRDKAGEIDVAVVELDRTALPDTAHFGAFTPGHLQASLDDIEVGSALLIVGFPLGFHDTLHHLPVVRHAIIASAFGVRFQGQGSFLTDARTHRGTSGAPVVIRQPAGTATDGLPWTLLGVHSARLDMKTRDLVEDESLGLNCAWYADILMTLTAEPEAGATDSPEPVAKPAAADEPAPAGSPKVSH